MHRGKLWYYGISWRCTSYILLLISIVHTGAAELVYPENEGRVYSRINHNVTISCDLTFPTDEALELLMWYQGNTFIIYKNVDGTLKLRDPSLTSKFGIVGENFTLSIHDVKSEDTGSYTCEKTFKKMVNGVSRILEENKTIELIVQEEFADNITEAVLDEDTVNSTLDNATLPIAYDVVNSTILDDNITNIEDVPSPPGIPTITNVNSRAADVSWEKSLRDNNSPIISYLINVKDMEKDNWTDSRVIMVSGDTNRITIRDLLPHVGYQIRVIAKNAIGNSAPSSASQIFITQQEKPSSPPVNLHVKEYNSSSITLAWDPPPVKSQNGIAGGYIVEYSNVGHTNVHEYSIEDPNARTTSIDKLKPFTNYTIAVKFFNEIGESEAAVIQVQTKEGVPGKPRIIHCSEEKSRSFVVNWEAPFIENGILKNYQLQWIHNNTYKTRIITGHLTQPMSANITGLEPYTKYELRVRAETGGGYSDYSDDFYVVTDVGPPSPPTLLNVTVVSPTSVYVQWLPPKTYYKRVDSYFIQCISRSEEITSISRTIPSAETKESTLCVKRTILLSDLPTNKIYSLKISAITNSIYSTSYFIGESSEAFTFQLEGDEVSTVFNTSSVLITTGTMMYNTSDMIPTDPSIVVESKTVDTVNAGMIAGVTVGIVFILVSIILVIGYRSMTCRKYTRSLYYLAVPTNSQSPQSTVVFPPDTIEEDTKYLEVKVSEFLQHTRDMHANSDDKFSAEFEDISSRTRTDLLAEASFLPENKAKNRYVNISAFDHTRVILQPVPGRPKSADYINANFIDGYNKPHAYIATQGPLPHTFADFWRMVWEQGSIVIIMITNLMERGRRKCDMYWPEEGHETYGSVTVKHINTFSRAHYTVRMFSLKSSKNKKKHVSERIVYQYHYTEWPDHGVPEFTLPVLKFIQKSSGENPPGAGPIVIHCSAGVGRTGTYILIESMIKMIKDKGTVNIPASLLHIRQQRNFLVQTEEQYMLIHDAIAEYILTQGDTEIKEHDISKYLENVTKQTNGEMTSLDIQYSLVTNFSPKPDDMFHALKNVNLCKNRLLDMVPLSVKRVILPMKPGVDGSDYINATYLQGYNKSNEFIITQHPLSQTVEDFWRMVWDQNTSVIVQLSETDDDEFQSFWPEKDSSMDIGCFKLTYREDDDRKNYTIKEFLLQSNQDDYILMTRIIRPNIKWPQECHPLHQLFDFVDEVQTLHRQNDIGPVIVVDKYGGVEATEFCALWAIYDQLQHDKSVNIYQLAKLYHLKRSNCVGTKENYLFLYRAAESLTKEWMERDRQSSPGSIRLHLGSSRKNGALPRSVTINSKIETDV